MDSVGSDGSWLDAAPASSGQRVRGRDSILLLAKLTLDGGPAIEARVRNLSEGGMMAEMERIVRVGTPVTVELRGIGHVNGHAAWCTEGRVGITFDEPINPRRARKPIGGGVKTPGYSKPL